MGSPAGQPQSAGESSRAGGRRPGALDARAAAYRRVGRSLPALGLLTGGVATIAGSVLPWVVFGPIHLNGLHRDGVITLPLAAAAVMFAILLLFRKIPRTARVLSFVLCLIIGLIALIDVLDISGSIIDVGAGLWLVVAGSAVGAGGGILAMCNRGDGGDGVHPLVGRSSRHRWIRGRGTSLSLFTVGVLFASSLLGSLAVPAQAQTGTQTQNFGVWAFSPGTGVVGLGRGDSLAQAEAAATAACQAQGGGADCRPRAWFENAYSAFAKSATNGLGVSWKDSPDVADSRALSECQQRGSGCTIEARAETADPSRPTGQVYQATPSYGVWGFSPSTGVVGLGRGDALAQAEAAATAACQAQGGGADCRPRTWFENAYSAFAKSATNEFGASWTDSPGQADSRALSACQQRGSGCTIEARAETTDPWMPTGQVYQPTPSYGAWGVSASTAIAASAIAATRAQAEADATAACQAQGGGSDCLAVAWFKNAYSSLAKASNGKWAFSFVTTSALADARVLQKCSEKGPDCRIVSRAETIEPWSPDGNWNQEPSSPSGVAPGGTPSVPSEAALPTPTLPSPTPAGPAGTSGATESSPTQPLLQALTQSQCALAFGLFLGKEAARLTQPGDQVGEVWKATGWAVDGGQLIGIYRGKESGDVRDVTFDFAEVALSLAGEYVPDPEARIAFGVTGVLTTCFLRPTFGWLGDVGGRVGTQLHDGQLLQKGARLVNWMMDWIGGLANKPSAGASQPYCKVKGNNRGYYYVQAVQCQPGTTGMSGVLSVHSPKVASGADHSLAEIAIAKLSHLGNSVIQNSIEVGWIVNPNYYGDTKPHLFIFPAFGAYPTQLPIESLLPKEWRSDKCYSNASLCGFVPTDPPSESGEYKKYESGPAWSDKTVTLDITLDGDKWWVSVNNTRIGYFPTKLWDPHGGFTAGNKLEWYGEVASSTPATCTDMGNGKFGKDPDAATVTAMTVTKNGRQPADARTNVTDESLYAAQVQDGQKTGDALHYGGRGQCT